MERNTITCAIEDSERGIHNFAREVYCDSNNKPNFSSVLNWPNVTDPAGRTALKAELEGIFTGVKFTIRYVNTTNANVAAVTIEAQGPRDEVDESLAFGFADSPISPAGYFKNCYQVGISAPQAPAQFLASDIGSRNPEQVSGAKRGDIFVDDAGPKPLVYIYTGVNDSWVYSAKPDIYNEEF